MSVLSNLEWMIQWMQEVIPIYEDYVKKNGMKLSQFLTNKYQAIVHQAWRGGIGRRGRFEGRLGGAVGSQI
ncbi:hypothetical protein J1N35_011297, partial [Gossypium stocksii]